MARAPAAGEASERAKFKHMRLAPAPLVSTPAVMGVITCILSALRDATGALLASPGPRTTSSVGTTRLGA